MHTIKTSLPDFSLPYLETARQSLHRLRQRKELGFFRLTERKELWTQSFQRAEQARATSSGLVVFGIGGSSLGAISLLEAVRPGAPVHFLENVDARDFWRRIESLPSWDRLHFAAVSKSGHTMETLSQVAFLWQEATAKGIDLASRFTVISELKSNPLTDWARSKGIPVLEIPEDVGGRFSVLSPVGLFPAAYAGLNLDSLRAGAEMALRDDETWAQLVAFGLAGFKAHRSVTLFWSYSNGLKSFGAWIQQLWAESLAKRVDRRGQPGPFVSTPVPLVGANDQHSVLQQVVEGAKDKTCVFLRVEECENFGPLLQNVPFRGLEFMKGRNLGQLLHAEAEATREVLTREGVPNLSLSLPKLDESNLGFLFMGFELSVGAMGEALGINAFDQPGVELGKRLARENLLA